jgi:uncharacterized protein DUF3107
MELRIGVVYTPKELTLDLDGDPDETVAHIESALADGKPILWVTDSKGRRVGVPVDKLAYIEVDAEEGNRQVGFGRP